MDAKTLRASILQMAIEGKLVPQLDDEPAVEQIGEAPEYVPFAIPEKWKWEQLGTVFILKAGKFISAQEISEKGSYLCYGGNGIRGKVHRFNREGRFPLIGRQGALCGNINIASGQFYATEHAVVADSEGKMDVDCAAFFLEQLNLNQYATHTAQPGLSVKRISETPFPLPPISEQRRIVARLNELLPLVDKFGKAQEALAVVQKEFPEKLKASLLQEAIQGKLVPQLDEEPAVEQIGEAPEDVPFMIPEKWKWEQLGTVFNLKAGKFISAQEISEKGPYLCYGGNGIRGKVHRFNREGRFPLIGRQGALCGNINIASGQFYATEHAVVADSDGKMDVDCAAFFLEQLNLNQYATHTAQPGLSVKRISETPFPLPPISEQRRIVARLNELLPLVTKLATTTAK